MLEPQIDVMAGWAVKSSSGMPAIYDSVSASSELVYKDFIHKNIEAGWTVAEEGSVPAKPICPLSTSGGVEPSRVSGQDKPKSTQKGADLQMRRAREMPLDGSVVQALNTQIGTVHLFPLSKLLGTRVKAPKTFCGNWAPGTPDDPAKDAKFALTSDEYTGENCFFGFCERCYGASYPKDRVRVLVDDADEEDLVGKEKVENEDGGSVSSSSSSESSSSSSK